MYIYIYIYTYICIYTQTCRGFTPSPSRRRRALIMTSSGWRLLFAADRLGSKVQSVAQHLRVHCLLFAVCCLGLNV